MKRDLVTETPAREFGAAVSGMVQALGFGSFEESLNECVELAHKSIGENFAAAAAPHGGQWPPRKPRKDDDGHPLLIKSGKLFQAATSDFGEGATTDVRDRDATIGIDPNEVPYAAVHQFGYADRNIPQREYEDVSDQAMDAMAELIADRGLELLR